MIVGSSFARATTGGSAQSAEGSNHSAPLGPRRFSGYAPPGSMGGRAG